MHEKNEKVYCKNCKWYEWTESCQSPNNIYKTRRHLGDWYQPSAEYTINKKPYEKNKNNNCEWYEEKTKQTKWLGI